MMNEKEKLYDTLLQMGTALRENGRMCMVWAGIRTGKRWRRSVRRINSM